MKSLMALFGHFIARERGVWGLKVLAKTVIAAYATSDMLNRFSQQDPIFELVALTQTMRSIDMITTFTHSSYLVR